MSLYDEIEKQTRRNEVMKEIRGIIDTGEFFMMGIPDRYSFAFTIGLYELRMHPEILIFSPNPSLGATTFLQIMGDNVLKGQEYKDGEKYVDIFDNGYPALFKTIERKFYDGYLGTAISFYKNSSFPAIQCFLPDKEGRFPSDPDCDKNFRELQTLRTNVKGQ